MKKALAIISISLSLVLLSSAHPYDSGGVLAPAAKCAVLEFELAFENAAAVFVGKVLKVKSVGQMKIFDMEVEKYWKGVKTKRITIYFNESMRYESQLEVGKRYLVFAEKDEEGDDRLFDRRCSRTKPMPDEFSALELDLEKLGDAKTGFDAEKK